MVNNKTIGITGGIGSGKSIVARILRCNGFSVYDCDSEAKYLMKNDKNIKSSLQEKFGSKIYLSDGQLNKTLLSKYLFTDPEIRNYVNSIVHSAVRKDIKEKREKNEGIFFIESAILISGGISNICNEVWIVEAPMESKIRRIANRDNISYEEILQRIKSQEEELELTKNTDFIRIINDNKHPILHLILSLVDKINNKQIYKIIC